MDGLRTSLVIHPPKEVYQYDEEFTIIVSDWYHTEHDVLLKEFIAPGNLGPPPMPGLFAFSCRFTFITYLYLLNLDSALIYFVKDGQYLPPTPGTTPPSVTSAVGFNENATLPFEPGKTYRLRIANIGAFNALFFWIDGHEMTIIEADGVCLKFLGLKSGLIVNPRLMSKKLPLEKCFISPSPNGTHSSSPLEMIHHPTGVST